MSRGVEGRSRGGRHKTSAARPDIGRSRGPRAFPGIREDDRSPCPSQLDEMKVGPALSELGAVCIRSLLRPARDPIANARQDVEMLEMIPGPECAGVHGSPTVLYRRSSVVKVNSFL